MADEFGIRIPKYIDEYDDVFNNIKNIVENYNVESIKNDVGNLFGINPFDLFILKTFIEKNRIKNILELGAGTSSKFIDKLNIERKSFAIESIYYDVVFEPLNIYQSYQDIKKYIKSNSIDLILIDCEHTGKMGKLIDEEFLYSLNYNVPLFIHDWMGNEQIGYSEQIYYIENILKFYDIKFITDLPDHYLNELKKINNEIDNQIIYDKLELKTIIRRCSAILTPKNNNYI